MRKTLILAALLLLPACSYPRPQAAGAAPPLPALAMQQANPRLALLESVLATYFAQDIANRPTVCAGVSDGRAAEALPPEDEVALIERFARLAPMSRCADMGGAWRDAETQQPALVFTLHGFTCASAAACTGWASYQAGATAARPALYRMEWGGSMWRIARAQQAPAP